VTYLVKVFLIFVLVGFSCTLLLVAVAFFLLRPQIPPVRKGSPLLVLADGIDFLLRLLQRVSQLLLCLIRLMRGKDCRLVHRL
jgi:hypothetical protein